MNKLHWVKNFKTNTGLTIRSGQQRVKATLVLHYNLMSLLTNTSYQFNGVH